MAGKPRDPDPGYVLRCAGIGYAEALIESGGKHEHPAAKRAWDRLRRAALRYRGGERRRGRPMVRDAEGAQRRLRAFQAAQEAEDGASL